MPVLSFLQDAAIAVALLKLAYSSCKLVTHAKGDDAQAAAAHSQLLKHWGLVGTLHFLTQHSSHARELRFLVLVLTVLVPSHYIPSEPIVNALHDKGLARVFAVYGAKLESHVVSLRHVAVSYLSAATRNIFSAILSVTTSVVADEELVSLTTSMQELTETIKNESRTRAIARLRASAAATGRPPVAGLGSPIAGQGAGAGAGQGAGASLGGASAAASASGGAGAGMFSKRASPSPSPPTVLEEESDTSGTDDSWVHITNDGKPRTTQTVRRRQRRFTEGPPSSATSRF